jgi:hypothetical protein
MSTALASDMIFGGMLTANDTIDGQHKFPLTIITPVTPIATLTAKGTQKLKA